MRSAPAHASYWLKVGKSLLVKCAYFSMAACICSVPASGSTHGRIERSEVVALQRGPGRRVDHVRLVAGGEEPLGLHSRLLQRRRRARSSSSSPSRARGVDVVLLRHRAHAGERNAPERDGGVDDADLAPGVLERLRRLFGGPARRGRDPIAIGAEHRGAVRLEERSGLRVDGVLRVHAPGVRGEHVGVGLRVPTRGRHCTSPSRECPAAGGTWRPGRRAGSAKRSRTPSSRRLVPRWRSREGLVWSSMTCGTSLCPSTPPSAFCIVDPGVEPAGELASSAAPGPVTDVM